MNDSSNQASPGRRTLPNFDAENFKRTLTYKATRSPDAIIQDMAALKEFDEEYENKVGIWTGVGVLGSVGIGIGVICLFNEQGLMAFVVGGIGLLIAAIGFAIRGIQKDFDVDNRRYEIVRGLLRLLSKDMAADEKVTISLNCRPHNHKSKLQRVGKVGYWDTKFFVDHWLTIQGRLLDGTKFTITLIEKQQDRHRTKRSASGKTKHKSKTKRASEAIVSLKIKDGPYAPEPKLASQVKKTLKIPNRTHFKAANVKGGALSLRTTTNSSWDVGVTNQLDGVNWIAMMFLSLYRVLNESKT